MSLSHRSRTAIYEGLSQVISDPDAVEEPLSNFPTRELDEPVSKEFHRAETAELRAEMHSGFSELRAEMHRGFQRMTLSLAALMVSMSGVTVAALTIAR